MSNGMARIAGTWRLQSFVFTDAAGNLYFPMGEDPVGAVAVTADGYLSLNFQARNRDNFANDDVFLGTAEERAAAGLGFVGFGGPCRVEGEAFIVDVEFSTFPNWMGGTQKRLFDVVGNTLTLRTQGARMFGGATRSGQAVLARA